MSLQEALDEACGLLLRCERYLPRDLELEVDSFRLACIQREVGLLPDPKPEPVRHSRVYCPDPGDAPCPLCVVPETPPPPERCPTCEGPCRYKDEVAK